ncbi:hypothetical protein CMI37_29130 [Candidatus Pacearchaeota archaeon]|jgi:hypothetical protein|nr:hypothetical protein [Candidatus Pacearchaeota archaeon]HCX45253.1 hypothetical protein [Patescibacteria group bacterium]|tara:strand:+ start:3722 stop:4507 length:786 start_codon:yes stop_codon:yes gene_type:complete
MKNIGKTVVITTLLLLIAFPAYAGDVSGYAWSSNIGWLKFAGPGYGVNIDDNSGAFSGYAWSPNIGWVNFNNAQLDFDNDRVSGMARACAGAGSGCTGDSPPEAGGWDGLISLRGSSYGVSRVVRPSGCSLEGWAWGSDVLGWLKFGGSNYSVLTSACPVEPLPPGGISCLFDADPERVIYPRGTSTVSWTCEGADTCTISGVGEVDSETGTTTVDLGSPPVSSIFSLSCTNEGGSTFSTSTEVTVLRPVHCEIVPHGPGC